ncbi:hypothetical protein F5148DRAFT_746400 [Russula earlei]|uniref:Uncharacterized protein n=1 Tax=Russula earlei TaxID=71964 RepID=A0ACC0UEP6_9AGAM|nr:hypothetical protein F5148DRAFT_746400 [Russula earlei]
MRHVLAIFCLTVGIAPLFAHASESGELERIEMEYDRLLTEWKRRHAPTPEYANLFSPLSPLKLMLPRKRQEEALKNVPREHFEMLKEINKQIDQQIHETDSQLDTLNPITEDQKFSSITEDYRQIMRTLDKKVKDLKNNHPTPESLKTFNRLKKALLRYDNHPTSC